MEKKYSFVFHEFCGEKKKIIMMITKGLKKIQRAGYKGGH